MWMLNDKFKLANQRDRAFMKLMFLKVKWAPNNLFAKQNTGVLFFVNTKFPTHFFVIYSQFKGIILIYIHHFSEYPILFLEPLEPANSKSESFWGCNSSKRGEERETCILLVMGLILCPARTLDSWGLKLHILIY